MKSRVFIITILCAIIMVCSFGMYSMLHVENKEVATVVKKETKNTLRSQVYFGNLKNTIKMNGIVINKREDDNYTLASVVKKNETVTLCCKLGEKVKKGDVIFKIGKTVYKSEVSGIIIDFAKEKEYVSFTILDYDMLYINIPINYAYIDKLSIGKKLKVFETNPLVTKKKHEETIERVGYIVDDNMIEVLLSDKAHYLPGTSVETELTYTDKIKSCYILKKMVLEDASGEYVYVEKNGKRTKRPVKLGSEFSSRSDGVTSEFVEICSGLKEGECLVVDVEQ